MIVELALPVALSLALLASFAVLSCDAGLQNLLRQTPQHQAPHFSSIDEELSMKLKLLDEQHSADNYQRLNQLLAQAVTDYASTSNNLPHLAHHQHQPQYLLPPIPHTQPLHSNNFDSNSKVAAQVASSPQVAGGPVEELELQNSEHTPNYLGGASSSALSPSLLSTSQDDNKKATESSDGHQILATGRSNEQSDKQAQQVPSSASSQDTSNSSGDNSQHAQSSAPAVPIKSIEPRSRRRMFNRILKKAEWNHLFVELSKVFLKYFLDLALKDLIGKQSGERAAGIVSSAISEVVDNSTGKKSGVAQSDIADLLKDFVKAALANM